MKSIKAHLQPIATIAKSLLTIAAVTLTAFTFTASAGQQNLLSTNDTVLAASTNSLTTPFFAGSSSDITFSPICTFTNASTNTFVGDASADNATWVLRVITMTAAQTTTGTNTVCAGITNLPVTQRYPYWRWSVENPSVYATKTPKVLGFAKTGI